MKIGNDTLNFLFEIQTLPLKFFISFKEVLWQIKILKI